METDEFFSFSEPVESDAYLTEQVISYIGNKRKLLAFIESALAIVQRDLDKKKLVILDGFAGSGVVSRMLKRHASVLHSNDLERYAEIIGNCYLTNHETVEMSILKDRIEYLNSRKLRAGNGVISDLYAPRDDENIKHGERVFYSRQNALIIDNIRQDIESIEGNLKNLCLAPLLYTASVNANTSGLFKGFYKNSETDIGQFGGNAKNCLNRIMKEITLQVPIFSKTSCEWHMHRADTNDLVKNLGQIDVAYFDPPYNQHPYGSNYFMLNVIADYVRPTDVSKVSGIPIDWNKSSYNRKSDAETAFLELVQNTKAKYIILSYSTEGILSVDELTKIFATVGETTILRKEYQVFRGSRNLRQRPNKLDELIFIIRKY